MNYYNEDEKRDEGGPVMGNSGAAFKKTSPFGKTPSFSRAAGSIKDRLKNLSKKDLAFVAVGMGVLITAPVAEYMMSKPTGADQLKPGFGYRSDAVGSGAGSLYEPGINALSQGSPDGSGEVITPLSSRDPASLILGSQPSQPPAAPQVSFPPKTDFRDSMKDSARAAFSEASKAAGVPTVIPRMQASLRGLSSFGGDGTRTTGSFSDNKILGNARNASGKSAKSSMVGPVAPAEYKGVASNSPNSASRGAFEKLRGQASAAAGNFNGDSAVRSLDKAAADSVDIGRGTGGLGEGGVGDAYRAPSGSSIRDSKSGSDKESLEQKLAENAAMEAQKWEFYKKYEIPKKIIEAVLGGFTSALTDFVKGTTEDALGLTPGPAPKCWVPIACMTGDCSKYIDEAVAAHVSPVAKYVCEYAGATAVNNKVGKDSASTIQEFCLCGKGGSPTYGGSGSSSGGPGAQPAPGGNGTQPSPAPGGNGTQPSPAPGGNGTQPSAAPASEGAANFKDYDGILQDIVDRTAETEANPSKAGENAKSVAGGFQNLSSKFNGPVNSVLLNARNEADSELGSYLGKINSAQGKFNETKSKYDTFVSQVAALEKDLNAPGSKVRMKHIDKSVGVEGMLDQGTKSKILDVVKQWKDNGPVYFASAEGNLEGQRKWHGAYSAQLQLVRKNMEAMHTTQTSIDGAVSSISGGDGTPIEKLQKMTGRLQGVTSPQQISGPDTAPAGDKVIAKSSRAGDTLSGAGGDSGDVPLKKSASQLRALDWDTLWQQSHKFDNSKAVSAEKASWGKWQQAVEPGNEAGEAGLDSFIVNQQRSNEIRDGVKSMAPNFPQIENDLARTEALMTATKNAAIGYGVSESYFGPGSGTQPDNQPGNQPGVQPAPGSSDSALASRKTALIANARLTGSEYGAATAVRRNLGNGTNAQYAKADYKNMTTSKTEIDRLVSEMSPANVKPTKAKLDELQLHLNNYNAAYKDFQTHAKASGSTVAAMPQPQIIINNNVQGGNATAISGASADATVHNQPSTNIHNTTNNAIVHQAPAALPKPAPSSFILGAYTMSTANNSGDTVVYRSERGMTAPVPFLTVTCTRKDSNTFAVTSAVKDYIAYTKATSEYNRASCK